MAVSMPHPDLVRAEREDLEELREFARRLNEAIASDEKI